MSRNPWPFLKNLVKKSIIGCGYIGYAGCVLHLFKEYICDPVICDGPSMKPTLHHEDMILAEHISSMMHDFHRGDIVIVRAPYDPKEYICKRIKGLPGDKVRKNLTMTIIPQGHVWLEGDNQSCSKDSRDFGPVPIGLIRSKAVIRIKPLKHAGFLR